MYVIFACNVNHDHFFDQGKYEFFFGFLQIES